MTAIKLPLVKECAGPGKGCGETPGSPIGFHRPRTLAQHRRQRTQARRPQRQRQSPSTPQQLYLGLCAADETPRRATSLEPCVRHPPAGTALSCRCSSTGPSGTVIRVQDIPPGSDIARGGTSSFDSIEGIFSGCRQNLQGYRAEANHSISRRNTATLIAPCPAAVMPPATINLSPWRTAAAARSSPSLKDRLR